MSAKTPKLRPQTLVSLALLQELFLSNYRGDFARELRDRIWSRTESRLSLHMSSVLHCLDALERAKVVSAVLLRPEPQLAPQKYYSLTAAGVERARNEHLMLLRLLGRA
jgi:DNA-binding PadR family transcriptional regulator